MINFCGFGLSKYKEMMGHEGFIMSGTLTWNGKPVSEFFDDGNGGMMEFSSPSQLFQEAKKHAEESLKKYELTVLESALSSIVCLLAEANAIGKKEKNDFICVVSAKDETCKKFTSPKFFCAPLASLLKKEELEKHKSFKKYIGLIPPKRGRKPFEMANDGAL